MKLTTLRRQIFLLLPLLLVTAPGCLKDPTLEDSPGLHISSVDVENAVVDAWELNGDHPYLDLLDKISLKESVTYENAYVIPGTTTDTVIKKNHRTTEFVRFSIDAATGKVITLNFAVRLVPLEGSPIATKPYSWESPPWVIDLNPPPEDEIERSNLPVEQSNKVVNSGGDTLRPKLSVSSETDPEKSEAELISINDLFYYALICSQPGFDCYNLETYTEFLPAPKVFSLQNNCGGLENCKLKVNVVKYTVAFKYEYEGKLKESRAIMKVKFAPQMPYLSRTIQKCTFQMYVINNQALGADYCQTVIDSKLGDGRSEPLIPYDKVP